MTQYKLRKGIENFQVVDGAFAGRKFVRGKVYGEVPPEEKRKFEKLETRNLKLEKKAEGKEQRAKSRE